MKKYLLIPLLGALSIGLSFAMSDTEVLNSEKDAKEKPIAHSAGKN